MKMKQSIQYKQNLDDFLKLSHENLKEFKFKGLGDIVLSQDNYTWFHSITINKLTRTVKLVGGEWTDLKHLKRTSLWQD